MCNPLGAAFDPKTRRKVAEKGLLGVGMKKGYAEYDRVKERMNPYSSPKPKPKAKAKAKPEQTQIKY
jgi:hypothetical protein